MTIGQRIAARRTQLGMTQMQLAQAVGVSNHSQVWRWEKDKNDPTQFRPKIARVLKLKVAELEAGPLTPRLVPAADLAEIRRRLEDAVARLDALEADLRTHLDDPADPQENPATS